MVQTHFKSLLTKRFENEAEDKTSQVNLNVTVGVQQAQAQTSAEIKERLSQVIMDAMSTIDIDSMTQNEKLKLIQIGLTYVIPRLKQVEEVTDDMPTNFQIEIIDNTSNIDK